ncbi:OmpH family outer membrane protein [Deinococcus detaillensis]|uniref:OmpH family outer membrane protein n=1 Tax=Deinococcus detaillensis TaxID=2592048 RepID=A0A553V082_9DEIO|nr:OmpH family outer membrane protein [Deinococcus detaillensis]TSA85862.1 OmpH family outer membrane protein [Deinococcus detaillensis]
MKVELNLSAKQTTMLAAVLITGLAGAATIKAGKLGLVDVQQVIASSKGGADFTAINKKADSALAIQVKTIQTLQNKISSGKASAADVQTLSKAQTTYQTASKTYDAQRQKAFAPIAPAVNAAVAAAAKAQGYTVVLDKRKAAASGVIIYANSQTTDLTAAAQKALKK